MKHAIFRANLLTFLDLGAPRLVLGVVLGAAMALGAWRALPGAARPSALAGLGLAAVAGSLFFAAIWLPAADPMTSTRAFYDRAAVLIGDAPVARLGVDDFAANWTLRRDVTPYIEAPRAASRFLETAPGPAFLVVERDYLSRHGMPPEVEIVLEQSLPFGHDLLLLAKAK
jgi:hypothetical protein